MFLFIKFICFFKYICLFFPGSEGPNVPRPPRVPAERLPLGRGHFFGGPLGEEGEKCGQSQEVSGVPLFLSLFLYLFLYFFPYYIFLEEGMERGLVKEVSGVH